MRTVAVARTGRLRTNLPRSYSRSDGAVGRLLATTAIRPADRTIKVFPPNASDVISRGGERIVVLYVDDEPSFAETAATFLEREHDRFTVETATSASDGLDRLAEREVDCIVSDYEMPGMGGIEFLEAVRRNHPDLPFVLFTGEGSEEIASEAISAGATDYLRKRTGTEQYTVLANRILNAVEQTRARAQRRLLHTAIETAQEGIGILDEDGRFQYVNETYAALYGYDPGELLGEHWELLYPDEEVAPVGDEIGPILEPDGYWHGRTTGRRADGSTASAEHVVSTTDTDETVLTARDVTDREERERTLTRLHAATRDLIAATSSDEVATTANRAAEDILGFPMNGVHLYDDDVGGLVPVGVTDRSRDVLGEIPVLDSGLAWEAYRTGEIRRYDDVREARDRFNADSEIRSELLLPLEEHGVLIVSSTDEDAFDDRDLTLAKLLAANVTSALDRTAHARKLELLQERTQRLMTSSDVETTVEIAVSAAHDILGAELSGFHRVVDGDRLEPIAVTDTVPEVFDTAPAYDRGSESDPVSRFVWEVFERGEPVYLEDTADHPLLSGETPAGSGILHPIGDHGVFVVTWTTADGFSETDANLVDILASTLTTALERVERASLLRDRTLLLERQNERLEGLASILSHDLRNPLQVASGRLDLARESDDDEHLDEIEHSLDRMAQLLESLVVLSRRGDVIDDRLPVALPSLIDDCWRTVETGAATLVCETDRTVLADRTRLAQVLENLFENASDHGDEAVTITVGTLADGDGFYVADDGPGIPPEKREQVFEEQYSGAAHGTGLGLAIVREIVDAHGWAIDVTESQEGGARFEITGVDFID